MKHTDLIAAVIAANRWHDEHDVAAYVTVRHPADAEGNAPAEQTAETVGAELAAAKPHWLKPTVPPPAAKPVPISTGVTGRADAPPPIVQSYAELLKPANREQLLEMQTKRPDELERLRTNHFLKRAISIILFCVLAVGSHGCAAGKNARAKASCMFGMLKGEAELTDAPTPAPPPVIPIAKPVIILPAPGVETVK